MLLLFRLIQSLLPSCCCCCRSGRSVNLLALLLLLLLLPLEHSSPCLLQPFCLDWHVSAPVTGTVAAKGQGLGTSNPY
jgi:hypothetical protein